MKDTLTTVQIADRLAADKHAGFSYDGARALAGYLEEIERDCGEEMEFDAVAIRCDYSEYDSASSAAQDYGWEGDADFCCEDDPDDEERAAQEWLEEKTTVIPFSGGVIVQLW